MKIRIRSMLFLVLAASGAIQVAHADDGEAKFSALRKKVAALKSSEPASVQKQIAETSPHITACTEVEPATSRVGFNVDGVEYLYATFEVTPDGNNYCFYLAQPINRALTAEEGRDFSAALMMPDIPRLSGGRNTASELAAMAAAGEEHFTELRALVAKGGAKKLSVGDPQRRWDVGKLENLVDCSGESVAELEQRYLVRNPLSDRNDTLYNGVYFWRDLDPDGLRCIYMVSPFKRGLTLGEARDLMMATQLDLGLSKKWLRDMDEAADADPRNHVAPAPAPPIDPAADKAQNKVH